MNLKYDEKDMAQVTFITHIFYSILIPSTTSLLDEIIQLFFFCYSKIIPEHKPGVPFLVQFQHESIKTKKNE